jgi:hypothetical protein
MGCVLHFVGAAADVAELQRLCPVEPCNVFRKGQARSTRPNARLARTSGVSLVASEAEFDELELQQAEALAFMRRHEVKLRTMRAVSGVEVATIDFGISMRNVFVQGDSFEPDLLAQIAALQMRMVLTQYPPQGRAKRVKQYRRALRSAA